MPTEYERGKAALDALIEWAEAHAGGEARNEATTRLHLINQLLVDVLRWPLASVRAEESSEAGWIDYGLGFPATQFIVEAKHEGVFFDLPAGTTTGVHRLEDLCEGPAGKQLRKALTQVAGYAASNGVAPAAVTNGLQLVLFIGSRTDGVAPLAGRGLVFPSLQDMRTEFRLLWDNASPAGIEQRRLHMTLRMTPSAPPVPLSVQLSSYPGSKRRNDLQAGLDILGELFLEDVARLEDLRKEFLTDCYATSGALSQYAQVSKQILQTRYALLHGEGDVEAAPAVNKKGLSATLTEDMLAAAASRRPIVLLGDVGVGKTTFIQRLVHVDAEELFKDSISLYIDFGSTTTLGRLEAFVVDEANRQLLDNYGIDIEEASFVEAVHHGSLNRFEKGVVGRLRGIDDTAYAKERLAFLQRRVEDRPAHLQASLQHLRASNRKQLVIFLDNIDQRSTSDQEQVFLIANELAQTWPATVFVTLRPETFYRSSRTGAISGYQPRVFTISPPRSDVMLQKRVTFVLKQLEDSGRLGSFPVGVTVNSESLVDFLQVLDQNFRGNTDLLTLIDNLAGGNMRLALKFVTDFIGSGHIDTRKILEAYARTGRYTIAVHEFLRALLFEDAVYYDPEASPIANLFQVSQPDGREHFLIPMLLAQIQHLGERIGDDGFVSAREVYEFAQGLGFNEDQIASALDHASIKRLIEGVPRYADDQDRLHYRITTVGAYSVRMLLAYFAYVDAVLIDTPIVDEQYRGLIQDVHSLPERVSRAEYFRIYLDRQWGKVQGGGLPWTWPPSSDRLAEDIRRVGHKADPSVWDRAP